MFRTSLLHGFAVPQTCLKSGRYTKNGISMNLKVILIIATIMFASPVSAEMDKTEELILAIALNQKLELIQRIVSEGGDVNKVVKNDSALMASLAIGKAEIIEFLLSKGANPNLKVNSFMTPLSGAITLGKTEVVQLMLSYGADINTHSGEFTPLLMAAQACNGELVELLLVNGANPKTKSKSGMSGSALAKFNGLKKPESECKYVQAIFNEFG